MKDGKIGTKKIGKNRIVVGIDQSYADSGIAVVYNGRLMAVTDCKPKSTDDNTAIRKQHTKSRDQQVKEVTLALEINKLKQNGLSIRMIAQQLNIGISTVQRYLSKGLY